MQAERKYRRNGYADKKKRNKYGAKCGTDIGR